MIFRSESEKLCGYAALDIARDGDRPTVRAVAIRAKMSVGKSHRLLTGLERRGLILRSGPRPMFHAAMFKFYGPFSGEAEAMTRRQ